MKIMKIESFKTSVKPKLRVAAYARVSLEKDAMMKSLSAQVSYYSDYIQKNKEWSYAGVFSDEAETGTKTDRPGFQALLAECRAGKIDMVITKAISRFARNTVDILETVRELKTLGIDVYFEKENIHTLSGEGELMLTLLASFSQEESRSVSENCKWRIQKRFEQGELVSLRQMYGYNITKGIVEINEEQAAVVRRIFEMYLEGNGSSVIANTLRSENIPSCRGGEWTYKSVLRILYNEKYTGNALLQKKYRTDHLTKKLVTNKGERAQYYAENTHPAIIPTATFDAVQAMLTAKRDKYQPHDDCAIRYIFTGRVVCSLCGKAYRRRIVAGKAWWICGTTVEYGRCACESPRISEETLTAVTAGVLRLREMDESVFTEEIAAISAVGNTLRYTFTDGRTESAEWENKSRSESWTDEMKKAASERQKNISQRRREK